MYGRNEYGAIIRDKIPAALGSDYTHGLNTSNFCVFAVQDVTGKPSDFQPSFRIIAPYTQRTATSVRMMDASGGGLTRCSFLVATQQSRYDVGPVVLGPTRTVFQNRGGRVPSYRSLHRGVTVPCLTGQAEGTVDVLHGLGSTEVLVVVQPHEDPYDQVANIGVEFWHTSVDANTVRIHAAMFNGAAFQGVAKQAVLCDVMVMSLHSSFVLGGGKYSAGYRAPANRRPSYCVGYYNVDVPAPAGEFIVHNLGQPAQLVLLGADRAQGGSVPGVIRSGGFPAPHTEDQEVYLLGSGNLIDLHAVILREYSALVTDQT